jgi:hypothetical protein
MDIAALDLDTCSTWLGDVFLVAYEDGQLEFTLIEAEPLRVQVEPSSSGFSLLFRGPAEPVFQQCVIPLRHADAGRLGLFVVPIRQEPEGTVYEAIINRAE